MIRNLKALGLALVALCALGAVVASAAFAQNGTLTADGPMTLIGTETGAAGSNALTAFGGTVECPGSTYTVHKLNVTPHEPIPNDVSDGTITPHYLETVGGKPNCKGPVGTTATIDMNGCDYAIHLGATTATPADTYGVTFDIVCPKEKTITVTFFPTTEHKTPLCIVHVPPQTGLKGADVTDTTNGDVDLTGTIVNIKATQTRNSILCPAGTETKEAKFDIDVTVKDKNGTSIGISHL